MPTIARLIANTAYRFVTRNPVSLRTRRRSPTMPVLFKTTI
jgi:hypothetical protein